MNLLIHVGLHKTGTTTLQEALHRNHSKLLEHKILYPSTGLYFVQHGLIPGSLLPNHPALDKIPRSTDPQFYVNSLAREVELHQPALTIISSEVFSEISFNKQACLELIHSLSAHFSDTQILLTTRDEKLQALSSACHILRTNTPLWHENPVGLYYHMLMCFRRWESFWRESGLPIIERKLEDSGENLIDHYIGEIIEDYSPSSRSLFNKAGTKTGNKKDRHNADPYTPLTYLIGFLLANSEDASIFCKNRNFHDISKECSLFLNSESQKTAVTSLNLIHYLDSFSLLNQPNTNSCLSLISAEDKQNALMSSGLHPDALIVINLIMNRLIQQSIL